MTRKKFSREDILEIIESKDDWNEEKIIDLAEEFLTWCCDESSMHITQFCTLKAKPFCWWIAMVARFAEVLAPIDKIGRQVLGDKWLKTTSVAPRVQDKYMRTYLEEYETMSHTLELSNLEIQRLKAVHEHQLRLIELKEKLKAGAENEEKVGEKIDALTFSLNALMSHENK